MDNAPGAPKLMPLHLLEEITNGFSKHRKLGGGAYGDVYLGEHKDGKKIAVKVLKDVLTLDDEEFEKEYHNIAILHHKNVVRLVGYCHDTQKECMQYNGRMVFAEKTKRALCFEYMENGSLDNFISDESDGQDWPTRYAIIRGICEGLEYLHEKLESPMYHLDLKPANVLLDKNMTPKIADFGLSRLFGGDKTRMTKTAIGTPGYVPPEYVDASVISIKFDIFSLGVVIIKIMTGPDGYFRSAEMSSQQFVELVHTKWMNRLKATSVHPYSIQVRKCIEVALSCVDADRHKRPTIGIVVNNLNKTDSMIKIPDVLSKSSGSSNNILDETRNSSGSSIDQVMDFPRKVDTKQYGSSGMPGSVQLVAIKHMQKAPLFDHNTKVMLELTGGDYTSSRPGLDLVAVLNVSGGMNEQHRLIKEVKTAMRFVLQKLGPMDRLSIVVFGSEAKKLCPLRQINEASRQELQELIDRLHAHDNSRGNFTHGLQTGLKVLQNRKVNDGRVAAIMLVTGDLPHGTSKNGEASFSNVPIYTFGLAKFADYTALCEISANSMGGTFSFAVEGDRTGGRQTFGSLTMAFSQCIAGLLTVAVRDLELTVATVRGESMILKVTAGSYPQTDDGSSVTIRFGDLYSREVRKVIVDLGLPTVGSERSAEMLSVTYSYSSRSSAGRMQYVLPRETLTVWRTGVNVSEEEVTPAVFEMEENRLRATQMMEDHAMGRGITIKKKKKKTIISRLWLSDKHDKEENKEVEAQLNVYMQLDPLLRNELLDFLSYSRTPGSGVWRLGPAYLLSMRISHGRQRIAARGDMDRPGLFATPRMDMYLEQAKKFLQYPAIRLPSTDHDDVASSQHPTIFDVASREAELQVLHLTMED